VDVQNVVRFSRNDGGGAEFHLVDGSISLHVKHVEGVEWIVHDGRYDVVATGTRFRVTHTSSVPAVEVFEGRVRVSGGVVGAEGVEVDSSTRTLAAAMAASETELEPIPSGTELEEDPASQELDALFTRAKTLRAKDEAAAEKLFREIVDRGDDGWISERAFEELRTLVAPKQRDALREAYEQRFPGGTFAEPFAAIQCQEAEDEAADDCWQAFAERFPNSLYGP
jgi:hypothetical protein